MPDELAPPFFPLFRITSEEEDREKDVMRTNGLQWQNYSRNPVIFINHQKNVPPVALCKHPDGRLAVELGAGYADGHAHFHGETEESREAEKLTKAGVLSGASIGVIPKLVRKRPNGGKDILKAEVVEWSLTPQPVCGACTRQKAIALGCHNEIILKAIPGECQCGGKTVHLDRAYLFPEKDFSMCQTVTMPSPPDGLELAKLFIPKADTATLSNAIEKAEGLGVDLSKANAGFDDGGYSLRWLGMGEIEPGTMQKSELADGVSVTWGKKAKVKVEPVVDAPRPLTVKSLYYDAKADGFAVLPSQGESILVKSDDVVGLSTMAVSKAMMHPAHRQRLNECYKAMGETHGFLDEHLKEHEGEKTQQAAIRNHRDGMEKCMGYCKSMIDGTAEEPTKPPDEQEVRPIMKAERTPEQKKALAALKDQLGTLTKTMRKSMGLPAV